MGTTPYDNVDVRHLRDHKPDTIDVEINYPRNDNSPIKYVEVGLRDVRAADNVRISYDFERDGWKIEQASVFAWEPGDKVCDPKWVEVAFVQAWGSKKDEVES